MRVKKNFFSTLISPIMPIYKNIDNIKIGILLLLVGGVDKRTEQTTISKGKLNICFINDGFFNKNTLFKNMTYICPRTHFIDKNRIFGENILASIIKDPESNNFFIEAGPLILSDQGICCIDNFIELRKQTNFPINEIMEQQTISIEKGNIKTILDLKTSILAFIDMPKKRYDKANTFQKNFGFNYQLLSFFDLFFLFLNFFYKKNDLNLSENIIFLNRKNKKTFFQNDKFISIIQLYLSFSRLIRPIIKNKSGLLIVRVYKYLRKFQFLENSKNNFFTVRKIESLIRLSEGFCKLYLGLFVKEFHVKAASRLFFNSFYPMNSSSKKFFRQITDKTEKFSKKKKRLKIFYKIKNGLKISFSEFRIIYRNIIAEIKYLENKGFCGIKLKFLLKRLMKNSYFCFSIRKKFFMIKKIILVIRFMIFSYHSLIIIKCFLENGVSKFINLIYLKK